MNKIISESHIIADGRWSGPNGIGRFSSEVLSRLQHTTIFTEGPNPLSPANFIWQAQQLYRFKNQYKVFFTPGFNSSIHTPMPFVFTLHDLIHLFAPGNAAWIKRFYYHFFMRPAAHNAYKILTVSDYSKQSILKWAAISEEKIVNVSCGVSEHLSPLGVKHNPGYPYLLHIGNTKPHKNVTRLVQAFAKSHIDSDIRFILTGQANPGLLAMIDKHNLQQRIIFSNTLSENELANYYRGAKAVVFPSLYEGFGLPVLEGMACGVPVLTSNTTSLPEVAGDAALLIDPFSVDSLSVGIEKICSDETVRQTLVTKGLERVKLFTWEKTASKVQKVLNELC
ncbi:MAG: glycosyltransferase family 1 protein [Gammaproteobacteria bacterium]